jgi:fused signal recognition particle receptor
MAENEPKKKGFFSGVFDKITSKFGKKTPQAEVQEISEAEEVSISIEAEPEIAIVEEKVVVEPVVKIQQPSAPVIAIEEKPVQAPAAPEKPVAAPIMAEKPIVREKPVVAPAVKEKPAMIPFMTNKSAPAPVAAPKAQEKPVSAPIAPVVQENPEPAPAAKEKPSMIPFFKAKPAPVPVVKEQPAPAPVVQEKPASVVQEKTTPDAAPAEEEKSKPAGGFFDKIKPANWFNRLKEGLDKTRKNLVFKMKGLFRLRESIDDDFWEELEEILLTADVGIETTEYVIEQMKAAVNEHYIEKPEQLYEVMKDKLSLILDQGETELNTSSNGLTVILVLGVNGVGKTTSIAKIANRYMQEGKQVLVAAADTFRAAAIEQLEVWGRKLDLEIIRHKEGSDPSAVVFDAVSAASARKADVLIIDTAGRLHSKVNLMKELEKIKKVIQKTIPDGPHETLLVLDSTNGQNALVQARTFKQSMKITGIILTKLDGTAKGGIVISIVHDLGIPIKFIGVGEGVYDLRPFEARNFLDALFADDSEKVPVTGS